MQYGLVFDTRFEDIMNTRDFHRMGLGQTIFFGHGAFDDWCAWTGVMAADGSFVCAKPLDKYYFEIAQILAAHYGPIRVYNDIRHVFEHTGKAVNIKLMDDMYRMSLSYGLDQEWAYNMLMHIHYGMVAEENKANTLLGATIKMNGLHKLLLDGQSLLGSANDCRGADWRDIYAQCQQRHIYRVSDKLNT